MAEPIAIVGGGPAGMALALALHRRGVATQIFDTRSRGAAKDDARVLALSHGARQILEELGVWLAIPNTPITTIHISQENGLGITRIRAEDEGVPALGYVLAAGDLAASLDVAIDDADIPFHDRRRVDPHQPSTAPLTVWADGAVDAKTAVVRDYGQHAVICGARTAGSHDGRAWERFTPQGPVAVLPFGREVAVVLTCAALDAEAIAAESDDAFIGRLQARFGSRLHFTAVDARHIFPLGLRYRRHPVGTRQVWIGNAAQTLHPVGGQGFNLALRDIHELAHCLEGAVDPGAPEVLARYAHARRLDRAAAIGFTDFLVRVFSNDNVLLRHARGAGLLALDVASPLRSFVARRMMFGARAW
jgi:2-octaprenyl-6-methoxyphenol hydroxylase